MFGHNFNAGYKMNYELDYIMEAHKCNAPNGLAMQLIDVFKNPHPSNRAMAQNCINDYLAIMQQEKLEGLLPDVIRDYNGSWNTNK